MVKRKVRLTVACLLAALMVLAAVGVVWAATASASRATIDGAEVGNVMIGDDTVIRYRVSAGGQSPAERARITADRINAALQEDDGWRQFNVQAIRRGNAIYAGDRLIATITPVDADAAETNIADLAYDWRDNIISALGGEPPARYPKSRSRGGYYGDWEGATNKWVPILDVNNNGVRIGAAQVAGPKVQVDKVKAVAQLGLAFRSVGRIKVYIPIEDYNVLSLHRVQGVSVWATGDIKIVNF
jgi:hypothetical protein